MIDSDKRTHLGRLAELQHETLSLLAPWDDATCRRQHHPELSPLAWHAGHCVFVETYWLRERVLREDLLDAQHHALFLPENTPKAERPDRLPEKDALTDWAVPLQADNLDAWRRALADRHHPLLRDGYLLRFIIQHYCQHLETMRMVLCRFARPTPAPGSVGTAVVPESPAPRYVRLAAGDYPVGSAGLVAAYDNELPARRATVAGFAIGARPVSNAEYLAFMADGGYHRPELWSVRGWAWLRRVGVEAPERWRRDAQGGWWRIETDGILPLAPTDPVDGISQYEAEALARWAGARLPHEHEWEAACRAGILEDAGRVWEWCGNTLFPYPGFRAFPYRGYSVPWFDGNHYVMRGGSRHTEPEIRRPGFRNFYQPDQRHMFAGVRLAHDA